MKDDQNAASSTKNYKLARFTRGEVYWDVDQHRIQALLATVEELAKVKKNG